MSDSNCYHCGLPVEGNSAIFVRILGAERRMCCAGCEAVAKSIVDNGLSDYYAHRDAMPETRREGLPAELRDLGLFDSPDFQASFVAELAEHEREASLLLEGISCAACVWLNEQHLAKLPGVHAVHINYATRRARVRWDSRQLKLSDILAAIQNIGYRAYPYDPKRQEDLAGSERKAALWRVFVAGFGMMQVMMYAFPEYVALDGEMTLEMSGLLRWASLVLTLPVIFYSSAPFFVRAWHDIRLLRLGMDVPVALGVGSAFLASLWATLLGAGEVYYDSVTMFVFLLLCGRYLEMLARQRAVRGAEELSKILPANAERLPDWPDPRVEQIHVGRLAVGDIVRIKPGEVVPADGVVVDGTGAMDESLLTGESRPVAKAPGVAVIGGAVNGASPFIARVTGVGDSTRLASIRRLMARAAEDRPRLAVLANRFAGWFIAAVIVMALLTGLIWWQLDPQRALWIFVSVLVVSCPCALSLATPVALTVATAAMARRGVLVTRGHAIESLASATHFVFDKTGTLTSGRMSVERVVPLGDLDAAQLETLALSLESGSEHRIAEAVRTAGWDVAARAVQELCVDTGRGVRGRIDGIEYRLGNLAYVAETAGPIPQTVENAAAAGKTCIFLVRKGQWLAAFVLGDSMRSDAQLLVAELRQRGLALSMLSGDAERVAREFGARVGIEDAHGDLLPEHKHDYVASLQRAGAIVAMVGDGVNDGPVLAKAHVSIAMGEGTELARNQADVVLLGGSFAPLVYALGLSRNCVAVIRQNLAWAFAYNLLAMPAAMAGWVTPWMAGLGMSASSLLVILNAMRLQRID